MDIIDSIELGTVEGFDIRADMVPDTATHHAEPDGDYTPEQIDWFNDGDWYYAGLIVTASRNGTDLGSDSLWAVEAGTMPLDNGETDPCKRLRNIDPLRDADGSLDAYRADMIDNAIADARLKLTELIDAAIDDSMGGE
jgi:hypothetical protein